MNEWASYQRVREAAEELKATIRTRYPEATFELIRAADQPRSWHLLAMVQGEDPDEVGDLVVDRVVDMLAEEHIPIHVIPLEGRESGKRHSPEGVRRTG